MRHENSQLSPEQEKTIEQQRKLAATVEALDKRINYLMESAEAAAEIYADRGMSAVCSGYTPENFDFTNQAPRLSARAWKLARNRDRILGNPQEEPQVKVTKQEALPF